MRKEPIMVLTALLASTIWAAQAQAAPGLVCNPDPTPLPMPPEIVESVAESVRWRPPFVAELEGPESPRAGELVRLRLEIRRELVDETPMQISVALPSSVRLVEGRLEERVVDPTSDTIVREFVLRLGASLPIEEVVVTVEQQGEAWGARAEKTYPFGRREMRALEAPLVRDRPVQLDNGIILRPVKVD